MSRALETLLRTRRLALDDARRELAGMRDIEEGITRQEARHHQALADARQQARAPLLAHSFLPWLARWRQEEESLARRHADVREMVARAEEKVQENLREYRSLERIIEIERQRDTAERLHRETREADESSVLRYRPPD